MNRDRKPTLEMLADSNFDPDDYKGGNLTCRYRCTTQGCMVRYAPGGTCGYCRGHVKKMRAEAEWNRLETKRKEMAAELALATAKEVG